VIAERTRGVGIIEIHELPIRVLCDLGVVELYRVAPDRKKVLIVAFLQCGGEPLERHAEIDRRLVHAGDSDRASLPGLGRVNDVHDYLPVQLSDILLRLVTKPIYSAAMLAQHVIALQTELHRPKPL